MSHSPTSPSGAHRWMKCPASVNLSAIVEGEPAGHYAEEGTAAHAALAYILRDDELEPWQLIGMTFNGFTVDQDMLNAVEVGVNVCRSLMTPATSSLIEQTIGHRSIEGFSGTVDFAAYTSSLLNIVDYKHGKGIVVECQGNPQMMYYAYGILLQHQSIQRVTLRIVQPRGYHKDGPVRRWETTARYIREWGENELLPAMQRTKEPGDVNPGDWCRFCGAKPICPAMDASKTEQKFRQFLNGGE